MYRRVLIIEDEATLRRVMVRNLAGRDVFLTLTVNFQFFGA